MHTIKLQPDIFFDAETDENEKKFSKKLNSYDFLHSQQFLFLEKAW